MQITIPLKGFLPQGRFVPGKEKHQEISSGNTAALMEMSFHQKYNFLPNILTEICFKVYLNVARCYKKTQNNWTVWVAEQRSLETHSSNQSEKANISWLFFTTAPLTSWFHWIISCWKTWTWLNYRLASSELGRCTWWGCTIDGV